MIRFFKLTAVLLAVFLTVFCIVSCSDGAGGPDEALNGEESGNESQEINNMIGNNTVYLDGSKIREGIVDYMRSMSAVKWSPSENFDLSGDHGSWGVNLKFKKGATYTGLPYTRAFSDLETFSQYISDGVYYGPCGSYDTMPGNNCSSACDLAWRQYLNSTTEATYTYVPGYGNKYIVRVGKYEYPSNNRDTYAIIAANSQDVIFEAYALCNPADAIVKWSNSKSAGHARMISGKPVIMRNSQGIINGGRSYLTVIEQTNKLTSKGGVGTTWCVDKIYTFSELIADGYIPVTHSVLADGNVEKPYVKITDPPTSKSVVSLLGGNVESNYRISEIELTVLDSTGRCVRSYTVEVENGTNKVNLRKYSFNLDIPSLPEGEYTFKVTAKTPYLGYAEVLVLPFEK